MQADQLRVAFHQAAINHDRMLSELRLLRETDFNNGEQRNAEWHAVRDNRLTASAFGNALGYGLCLVRVSIPGCNEHQKQISLEFCCIPLLGPNAARREQYCPSNKL